MCSNEIVWECRHKAVSHHTTKSSSWLFLAHRLSPGSCFHIYLSRAHYTRVIRAPNELNLHENLKIHNYFIVHDSRFPHSAPPSSQFLRQFTTVSKSVLSDSSSSTPENISHSHYTLRSFLLKLSITLRVSMQYLHGNFYLYNISWYPFLSVQSITSSASRRTFQRSIWTTRKPTWSIMEIYLGNKLPSSLASTISLLQ